MKLGEALSLRAKQAQKLNDLSGRIKLNAMSQEGETAAESATNLLDEYLSLSAEHRVLVSNIALTNANTSVGGTTLLAMLHEREHHTRARNIYAATAAAGSTGRDMFRYGRSEIRSVTNVNVADLRKMEDQANEEVRKLDAQIQEINWKTELL